MTVNISTGFIFILILIFLFILYILIETGVRRGINSSKTHDLLKEILEELKKQKWQVFKKTIKFKK